MKRSLVLVGLLFCLLIPPSTVSAEEPNSWEIDLQNGYISTKPIIVEDQVIVRTSGYWTGEDRPHVYAFDLQSGEENWRYRSASSTNHDMTPLLHVEAGSGDCGNWSEMVLVGWTDGKVTALDITDGSLVWSAQTEVIAWGITGAMSLDSDLVVVPTRKGLSTFCLDNGNLELRVDLPQLGWRNGVTVNQKGYYLGNEEGVLNIIYRNGSFVNQTIDDGKIRHAPLIYESEGEADWPWIHLQTTNGSFIYGEGGGYTGYSPAIPVPISYTSTTIHHDFEINNGTDFYGGIFATSNEVMLVGCSFNSSIECDSISETLQFHTNGEISINVVNDSISEIWLPRNTPSGGWGVIVFDLYSEDELKIDIYSTNHDTYTTAGPGFGPNGELALGNDNGVLMVFLPNPVAEGPGEEKSFSKNLDPFIQESLVLFLCITMFFFQIKKNNKMATKVGLLLLLVIMILILPDVSNIWSKEVDKLDEPSGDWDDSWPEEWQDTQVMVFELPDGELVVGGFAGYDTVEAFTDAAAADLDITLVKESYDFGAWITSFNGHDGEGWEFTIDGKRSSVGISEAELSEDSVVRWSLA